VQLRRDLHAIAMSVARARTLALALLEQVVYLDPGAADPEEGH
jgi:hypothetical protein